MLRRCFARRLGVLVTVTAAVWVLNPSARGFFSAGSSSYAAPSPLAPDLLLENQWHLKSRALETGGANVRDAWPMSQGAGVVIGIVDDGLQYSHPDLAPNYLASASYDFNFNDADPFPTSGRGTAVAGLAAARGDNTIGVSGAAPQASLAALRLTALVATDAQEAAAFGFQPDVIDILNNSWNPTDNGTTLKGPGPLAAAARQSAATTGRQGKGRIFVWSSGNGRLLGDDCNFDGYANNRFAIAVGASTDAANQMVTSEGCSALMVMAPSGGGSRALTTTDLIGSSGYDSSDYTSTYGSASSGAMSAAAPTVSGAVALMLARNPNLSWRDVQHILRNTGVRILPTDSGWTVGAFPHNERLGFGLLDAAAAVNLAGTWTNVPAEEVLAPATRTLNQPIPDINATGISDTITISGAESNFVIEHVEVVFNATHSFRGDLKVKLTSPSGVVSNLAPVRFSDGGDFFTDWKFGSVRHWGQTAAGVWTLNVADRQFQDTGTWNNWTLRIYGYHTAGSAPAAFAKSSPASGATGVSISPTLSWAASSGATGYEYCYDSTNDGACSAWTSTGTNTSVALGGLSAGASYYWHVRAANATGVTYAQGSATAFWGFSTIAAPAAFVHSSPANGATGQPLGLTLSWTASAGATSYEYCYDTSNNSACNATWISVGNATSVALSGLTAATPYYWHVRALNAAAVTYAGGSPTTFRSFTTASPPDAFTHSWPSNGATGQPLTPTLYWSWSTGVTSYEYCYDTTNDGACTNWINIGTNTEVGLSGLTPGTPYYWHVRATNTGGTTYAEGAATAFWGLTTMATPGAFTHGSPSNGATGQALSPTLTWAASSTAASYEYCIDTSNNGACNASWISVGGATSVALSGLTPGTPYYWHVRAINAVATTYAGGGATTFWNFTTQVALPAAFGHNSPGNGATGLTNSPTLSWSASAGAASFEYCIDTTNNSACDAAWTTTGTNTSAVLSNLAAGTAHYWQVRAINSGGTTYAEGAATSFWTFTTLAVPAAFSHTSPANGATGQSKTPTLSWPASAGATDYQYCIDTTNDSACSGWTSTGTNTSVGLSTLSSGTQYFWHVRATNAAGTTYAEGAATTFWSFTTVAAPGVFTKANPANGATGLPTNLTVSWTASAGATGYEVCFDTTNDSACSGWSSTGANTSADLNGLDAGTPYYWHVRATNAGGTMYAESNPVLFWTLTTAAALPGAFGHSSPANGASGLPPIVTLGWTASTGATSYEYCIDTSNNGACNAAWTSTGANTSVGATGLMAGTAYFWHVRALNAGGTTYADASATAFWSFTTRTTQPQPIVDLDGDDAGDVFAYNPATGAWAREATLAGGGFAEGQGIWAADWTTLPASFNADALTDFFIFNSSTGEWFKMLNTGAGFSLQATSVWWPGWQKFVLDLNGDGISDLFLYDPAGGQWYRSISTPTGFTHTSGWWNPGWEITPMNLNGDAFGDLFLMDRTAGRWFWVVGEADGSFTYPQSGYWQTNWDFYTGDFNGDGLTDLFLYRQQAGEHYVAMNTGAGFTYTNGAGWTAGWTPLVLDLDADGLADLFLYNKTTGTWFELLGNGAGQFTSVAQGAWTPGWEIHPTDFNADGRADLVLHRPGTGEWFQAWNYDTGVFTYFGGQWQAGLKLAVRAPVQ